MKNNYILYTHGKTGYYIKGIIYIIWASLSIYLLERYEDQQLEVYIFVGAFAIMLILQSTMDSIFGERRSLSTRSDVQELLEEMLDE